MPRSHYGKGSLDATDLPASPFMQLQGWLDEAEAAGVIESTAMCLSTVDSECRPSSRMVLLRGLDERGLCFFTNRGSRKGDQIQSNQAVCANFWWGGLERQIRVEGLAEPISDEESDAYFASRPRESQLASAASPQSQVVRDRQELEDLVAALDAEHPTEVPRPENWGGYRIVPNRFEFWQGRPARLHDRLNYSLEDGAWVVRRLAP